MSWLSIGVLAVGAYGFKLAGVCLAGRVPVESWLARVVALLPASMLAGLVAVQTFSFGRDLVLDARAAGVGVGALLAIRRMPIPVVMIAAGATTAALRALS